MKFLSVVILWCLQKFGICSKLNFDKINNNPKKNIHTNVHADLLPLNKNKGLLKKCSTIKFSGYDERYLDDERIKTDITDIFRHIENKAKLDILQDSRVSIFDKLELLNDNYIKPPNMHSGGLMDDFTFELDNDSYI